MAVIVQPWCTANTSPYNTCFKDTSTSCTLCHSEFRKQTALESHTSTFCTSFSQNNWFFFFFFARASKDVGCRGPDPSAHLERPGAPSALLSRHLLLGISCSTWMPTAKVCLSDNKGLFSSSVPESGAGGVCSYCSGRSRCRKSSRLHRKLQYFIMLFWNQCSNDKNTQTQTFCPRWWLRLELNEHLTTHEQSQ